MVCVEVGERGLWGGAVLFLRDSGKAGKTLGFEILQDFEDRFEMGCKKGVHDTREFPHHFDENPPPLFH
jgi:hypothetical protein